MTMSNEQNNPDEQNLQHTEIKQEEEKTTKSEGEKILDPKDQEIYELKIAINEAQQRERENFLRTQAELENTRRRIEQDVKKAHKFALEHFIGELLPVIDNLERALEMSDKTNSQLSSTIEGIELTLKSLMDVVRKFGVDIIENAQVPFNPEIHQAVTMLDSEEHIPNQVIMIMQKGYILNGRLIRPAMVTVSKEKIF
ncbi:nucleotide exchange factor GrpE [Candidatus Curculioniphilus buchneri]|uniref:nucleotide exchange factor GrpE n=1 Tax=Candidatus Curculioniphilus buchneri TaxID=690594 RepID=UPI00376F4290